MIDPNAVRTCRQPEVKVCPTTDPGLAAWISFSADRRGLDGNIRRLYYSGMSLIDMLRRLMTFQNGLVPFWSLRRVQGVWIYSGTAKSLRALIKEAKAEGVAITIAKPVGGYRSILTQRQMHKHPDKFNLVQGIVLAAIGASTHGLGTAVDIVPGKGHAWVLKHGKTHFLAQTNPENDPNHFQWKR